MSLLEAAVGLISRMCLSAILVFVALLGGPLAVDAQEGAFNPDDLRLTDVTITRVDERGWTDVHVTGTLTNASAHAISGIMAYTTIWGDRPAALDRVHLRELGDVLAGGLLPGETMTVSGKTQIGERGVAFAENATDLRLKFDVYEVLDLQLQSLMCREHPSERNGRHIGPSPAACAH
jgi:hypothetical protein